MNLAILKYKEIVLENGKLFLGGSLGLALFFFVLLPTFAGLPKALNEKQIRQAELARLKEKEKKLNQLVSQQQALKTSIGLADKALPSKDEVPLFMTQIQAVATESGVTLKALQFTGISREVGSGFKKISLQALEEGSFANILANLTNLEKASRIIHVVSIAFDSRKGQGILSVTLGLDSYFLDPESLKDISGEPIRLDFTSPATARVIDYLKTLKIYEMTGAGVEVGKSNPFE